MTIYRVIIISTNDISVKRNTKVIFFDRAGKDGICSADKHHIAFVGCAELDKKASDREKMRILARLTVKKFVNSQIIVSTDAKIWYNSM